MKIALAVSVFLFWVAGYELATHLRRRAGIDLHVPLWSRWLTVAVVVFAFLTRTLPFAAVLALTATLVFISQVLTWRATAVAARSLEHPRLVWMAAAIETAAIVAVFAGVLFARHFGYLD